MRKREWIYALLLAVRGKVESIKAKCCLVYLRLLQIMGENSRNSVLGGETSGFLWGVAATLQPSAADAPADAVLELESVICFKACSFS